MYSNGLRQFATCMENFTWDRNCTGTENSITIMNWTTRLTNEYCSNSTNAKPKLFQSKSQVNFVGRDQSMELHVLSSGYAYWL